MTQPQPQRHVRAPLGPATFDDALDAHLRVLDQRYAELRQMCAGEPGDIKRATSLLSEQVDRINRLKAVALEAEDADRSARSLTP